MDRIEMRYLKITRTNIINELIVIVTNGFIKLINKEKLF